LVVDGTNTVLYLHRGVRGERIVGTVGAGLVPALGTHKGCPYVGADYVTVFRKRTTKTLWSAQRSCHGYISIG
ncbi:MAG: hypothetical protein AB1733_11330, partial [Thermodesulfobacteriota bacterium]